MHGQNLESRELPVKTKEVAAIILTAVVATLGQVALIKKSQESPNSSGNPVNQLFDFNKTATIIHEYPASKGEDDVVILSQTLSDGTKAIARKPVWEGVLIVKDVGDEVMPDNLAPPLPEDQP